MVTSVRGILHRLPSWRAGNRSDTGRPRGACPAGTYYLRDPPAARSGPDRIDEVARLADDRSYGPPPSGFWHPSHREGMKAGRSDPRPARDESTIMTALDGSPLKSRARTTGIRRVPALRCHWRLPRTRGHETTTHHRFRFALAGVAPDCRQTCKNQSMTSSASSSVGV